MALVLGGDHEAVGTTLLDEVIAHAQHAFKVLAGVAQVEHIGLIVDGMVPTVHELLELIAGDGVTDRLPDLKGALEHGAHVPLAAEHHKTARPLQVLRVLSVPGPRRVRNRRDIVGGGQHLALKLALLLLGDGTATDGEHKTQDVESGDGADEALGLGTGELVTDFDVGGYVGMVVQRAVALGGHGDGGEAELTGAIERLDGGSGAAGVTDADDQDVLGENAGVVDELHRVNGRDLDAELVLDQFARGECRMIARTGASDIDSVDILALKIVERLAEDLILMLDDVSDSVLRLENVVVHIPIVRCHNGLILSACSCSRNRASRRLAEPTPRDSG